MIPSLAKASVTVASEITFILCDKLKSFTMAANNDGGDENWQYPRIRRHQYLMAELMSWKHGRWNNQYHRDTVFSMEQLLELQPIDIKRWLAMRISGKPDPDFENGDTCDKRRADTLQKNKHAVSLFMPNQHVGWIEGVGGNPTQHALVNNFIKLCRHQEQKGLGKDPNDKRPYRQLEFDKLLEILRDKDDFDHKYKFPMMTLWSYHLIHRIDDTAHFKVADPHGSHEYPFAMFTRTKWSKNVRSKQQCPPQILLGSMDWKNCVQVNFANYLEMWLTSNSDATHLWTNNEDVKKGPHNIKQQYRNRIDRVVWQNEEFEALEDEPESHNGLGTHSGRKFYADKSHKKGAESTQTEYRGRWIGEKGSRTVNKHYIRVKDIYTDAFVAALMCDGGAVKYKVKDGLVITDEWLFSVVIPSIRRRFQHDDRLCRVVGLARLWSMFDADASDYLPLQDVARIKHSFGEYFGDEEEPVIKVPIEVVRVGMRCDFVEVSTNNAPDNGQQPQVAAGLALQQHDMRQLTAAVQQMNRNLEEHLQNVRAEQLAFRTWTEQQFNKVVTNQRRFGGTIEGAMARQNPRRQQLNQEHTAIVEAQRVRVQHSPQPNRQADIDPNAKLEKNLKSLFDYWQEYRYGMGNNKPAKDFTSAEINRQGPAFKKMYWWRMKLWRVQTYLVNQNMTIEAANTHIMRVFEVDKPTAIIICIARDQKNSTFNFVGGQRFRPGLLVRAR